MKRAEIERLMNLNGQHMIALVINKDDPLGILCYLKRDYLVDYTGHRINARADIWGYLSFKNGKPVRFAWEEK